MITRGAQNLTYDAMNRLVSVAQTGQSTVTFGYGEGNARLWKKVNGNVTNIWISNLYEIKDGTTLIHVLANGKIIASYEPTGQFADLIENNPFLAKACKGTSAIHTALFKGGRTPMTLYSFAIVLGCGSGLWIRRKHIVLYEFKGTGHRVVCMVMVVSMVLFTVPELAYAGTPVYTPVFYYYHADHLGSSSVMTDFDGDIVQDYGYTAFGKERYKKTTYAFNVSNRYTGQILDEETELYFYGARYYDPQLARFIQPDSIVPQAGSSQSLNRYSYVNNNPLKYTDPSGHSLYIPSSSTSSYVEFGGGGYGGYFGGGSYTSASASNLAFPAISGGYYSGLSLSFGITNSYSYSAWSSTYDLSNYSFSAGAWAYGGFLGSTSIGSTLGGSNYNNYSFYTSVMYGGGYNYLWTSQNQDMRLHPAIQAASFVSYCYNLYENSYIGRGVRLGEYLLHDSIFNTALNTSVNTTVSMFNVYGAMRSMGAGKTWSGFSAVNYSILGGVVGYSEMLSGIIGTNVYNFSDYSTAERWYHGVMGFVQTGLFVASYTVNRISMDESLYTHNGFRMGSGNYSFTGRIYQGSRNFNLRLAGYNFRLDCHPIQAGGDATWHLNTPWSPHTPLPWMNYIFPPSKK